VGGHIERRTAYYTKKDCLKVSKRKALIESRTGKKKNQSKRTKEVNKKIQKKKGKKRVKSKEMDR